MKGNEITIKLPRFCSLSGRGVRLDDGKKHTIGERHAGTGWMDLVSHVYVSLVLYTLSRQNLHLGACRPRSRSFLSKSKKKQSYVGNVM